MDSFSAGPSAARFTAGYNLEVFAEADLKGLANQAGDVYRSGGSARADVTIAGITATPADARITTYTQKGVKSGLDITVSMLGSEVFAKHVNGPTLGEILPSPTWTKSYSRSVAGFDLAIQATAGLRLTNTTTATSNALDYRLTMNATATASGNYTTGTVTLMNLAVPVTAKVGVVSCVIGRAAQVSLKSSVNTTLVKGEIRPPLVNSFKYDGKTYSETLINEASYPCVVSGRGAMLSSACSSCPGTFAPI